MNELDALLKELNDPRSSYFPRNPTPSTLINNPQLINEINNPNMNMKPQFDRDPMYNNMRFQQEPTPDQSPMKSPIKPMGMNQFQKQMFSPNMQQPSGMKLQQNNMPDMPFSPSNKLNNSNMSNSALFNKKMNDDNEIKQKMIPTKQSSPQDMSPQLTPSSKPITQGQKQTRKIICATCKGQIKGKVVSCLGKTWHPEHFICQAGCKKLLDPNRFFEKNHLPCCENCHRESFVPRCAYCGDVITEKCITALGTTWHTDHFFCCQCAVQFPAGSGFLEKDGKAYCERDYYRLFATRCGKCGEIIVGEYISALGKEWHNKCFTCKECGCSFPTESFYEYKGMPYCETHYHLKRGSLCSRCNKPIVGRCISASGKKYHPEHFTCVKCNKLLASGNIDDEYKEVNGNPFCGQCASRIRF